MTEETPSIATESIVVRSDEPLSSELDGETVLLNVDTGAYHGLDEIGTRIWTLIEQPTKVSALCVTLREEFDVEPEPCESQVLAFLEQLKEAELLLVTEASS